MKSISHLFFSSSHYDSKLSVVLSKDKSFTASGIDVLVNRLTHSIHSQGVRKGDHVPVLLDNGINFIISIIALWRLNAIPVPLNIRLLQNEIAEQLIFLDCRFIITEKNFDFNLPFQLKILPPQSNDNNANELINFFQQNADDIAVIIFTSGSSGNPRAVQLSFANLYYSALTGDQLLNHRTNDKWIASLPFYHIGGFSILIRSLLFSVPLVIPFSIKPDYLAESINLHKPTLISLVAAQLSELVKIEFDNSSIRNCLIGGGATSESLISESINKGWNITKVYGSSESSAFIAGFNVKDFPNKINSSGKILYPNEVIIVDENMNQASPLIEGEICIKGNTVMKGYLHDTAGTKNLLEGNFYHTGDYGYIDKDGFLFITSRRTDLISTGGENVNPLEVETVLNTFDGIIDSCVFGLPDNKWGSIVAASIILKKGYEPDENKIKNHLRKSLPSYKIPVLFFVADHFPKTELGKTKREVMRKFYSDKI